MVHPIRWCRQQAVPVYTARFLQCQTRRPNHCTDGYCSADPFEDYWILFFELASNKVYITLALSVPSDLDCGHTLLNCVRSDREFPILEPDLLVNHSGLELSHSIDKDFSISILILFNKC